MDLEGPPRDARRDRGGELEGGSRARTFPDSVIAKENRSST